MRRHTPSALLLPLVLSLLCLPGVVPATAASAGGGGADPRPVPRGLRLNEIDYDQPGVDAGEFVEIMNVGERRYRLGRTALVLVNGTTSAEYRRVWLSGKLGPGRRLVVATGTVVVHEDAKVLPLPLAHDNLQNGAPDAIALVDAANDVLVDAVSYEGAITAATIDGLPGTWPLGAGTPVSESDGNEVPGSLCRLPDGADTGDDDADWALCRPTPGRTNRAPSES